MIEERRNLSPKWIVIVVALAGLLALASLPAGAQTSTIFGVVTEPDGVTPVEGANIELRPADSTQVVAWDTTLVDGTFALASASLPAGRYTLIAHPPQERGAFWDSQPKTFEVPDKVTDIDLAAIRLTYVQVRGTVLEPDGVKPYAQGDVNLVSKDGKVSLWDTSKPFKNFAFSDLEPGQYYIKASLPEDSPFWAPDQIPVEVKEKNPAKPGQTSFITITLSYVQVEGVVVEPDGKTRVSADSVNIASADGKVSLWGATTITRTFRFGGLEPGGYLLQVFLPENSPQAAPAPLQVEVKEKNVLKKSEIEYFTLRLAYPQLQGAVFEPDGKTRAGKWDVSLTAADGKVVAAESGTITQTFRLGGLAPGTYSLQAEPPAPSPFWSSKPVSVTIAPGSQYEASALRQVDLAFTYPQVVGFVTGPDGKTRLSRGDVNLRTADEAISLWDSSTVSERFRFGDLKAGAYLLEAQAPADSSFMASPIVPITITGASLYLPTVTQQVELALTYPQIEGIVLEPDGETQYGAGDVKLWNAAETMAVWAALSPGSTFRFGRLPSGPYGLKVVLPPGSPFWAPPPLPVNIKPGSMYQPPQVITITLENTNVTGKIMYKGKPMANATVGAYDYSGKISNWTTTDSEGNFSIGGLRPDRYTIGVETGQIKTAEHWIGPVDTILFNLPDTKTRIDLGVIHIEDWLPFMRSNLRRAR
jgi:WD40 repeat protein